jgi:hypothetical protein
MGMSAYRGAAHRTRTSARTRTFTKVGRPLSLLHEHYLTGLQGSRSSMIPWSPGICARVSIPQPHRRPRQPRSKRSADTHKTLTSFLSMVLPSSRTRRTPIPGLIPSSFRSSVLPRRRSSMSPPSVVLQRQAVAEDRRLIAQLGYPYHSAGPVLRLARAGSEMGRETLIKACLGERSAPPIRSVFQS